MADDFDVEAMLEAPFRQEETLKKKDSSHRDDRDRKRRRSRSKSRDRRRSRSRENSRGKDRKGRDRSRSDRRRKSRSRSRERYGSRPNDRSRSSRDRDSRKDVDRRAKSSSRERDRNGRRSPKESDIPKLPIDIPKSPSPKKDELPDSDTRDARTVFVMQLSQRVRERDLAEFFSSVGRVRDSKIITDRNSRRSKGVGYVEFDKEASVQLALGLNNQRLMGAPIIVQPSHSEKNRLAAQAQTLQKGNLGPMRIYVGSLHFNINEEMLRGIFEPFGRIDNIQLIRDTETQRSKGYGFITFQDAEDAKRALDQLNGFELAGRPMKVGHVTERTDNPQDIAVLDSDDLERTGIGMTQTGRLQLMAKLAEGTNFQIPSAAAEALHPLAQVPGVTQPVPGQEVNLQASLVVAQQQAQQAAAVSQPAATTSTTPCFLLSNMFDPSTETAADWDLDIRDDVIAECSKHGGVLHIHVDKASPEGNVYVKCPTIPVALAAVNSLHGRWFAGKMITAAFVPLANYHTIFPQSAQVTQPLQIGRI